MTPTAGGGDIRIFTSNWVGAPATLPPDTGAWAIGDVHGQLDLLDALLGAVEQVMAAARPAKRHLVMMGDYIDRGPDNIGALERVGDLAIPGVTVTRLMGNHEEYLNQLLDGDPVDEDFLSFWVANGGASTLANLGLSIADLQALPTETVIAVARAAPRSAAARSVLAELQLGSRLGGYLFVHAGVHPAYTLEDARQAFTTLREPFLSGAGWTHDFAVVHGHTIAGPAVEGHRIAVDSGAFWTGVLTCVELRDDRARFIAATRDPDLARLRSIRRRRPLAAERWTAL